MLAGLLLVFGCLKHSKNDKSESGGKSTVIPAFFSRNKKSKTAKGAAEIDFSNVAPWAKTHNLLSH